MSVGEPGLAAQRNKATSHLLMPEAKQDNFKHPTLNIKKGLESGYEDLAARSIEHKTKAHPRAKPWTLASTRQDDGNKAHHKLCNFEKSLTFNR